MELTQREGMGNQGFGVDFAFGHQGHGPWDAQAAFAAHREILLFFFTANQFPR